MFRFHSIAENIINEYILILSYLVLFSPNQTRWPCLPAWNMLRSSVSSHLWPSCITAMNQALHFCWANPIIQFICASLLCAHFQSVESIMSQQGTCCTLIYLIFHMNYEFETPTHCMLKKKKIRAYNTGKNKKGSFWKFWHKANSS
jgi:hypothetical protein